MKRTNLIKGLNLKWLGLLLLLFGITVFQNSCSSSGSKGNPPSAPTGVTATAGNAQVTLSWNKVSNAAAYNIYWSTSSGVTPANGTKIPNVTTPYTQPGLTNGVTYYYVVTAINNSGESAPSAQVSATPSGSGGSGSSPATPTGVIASPGNNEVVINWNSVSGATSYNIYWSTTTGVTTANGTKIAGVTNPYIHTGLTNGTTYYYIVTAVNSYGESAASSQVSATPSATGTPPAPPTGVSATAGNQSISGTWNASVGATSYNIYCSTTSGVTPTNYEIKITDITNTQYTGTGLTNGVTYYCIVTAVNSYGESAPSAQVSATPSGSGGSGTSPATPTGVTAASPYGGGGEIDVSWNGVSDAAYYNVYYSTTPGTEKTNGIKISDVTGTQTYVYPLTNGTTYYFVVTAVNGYGESAASAEVSAIAGSPSPPYTITASSDCSGNVTVNWSDFDPSITSYNLYYSTTSGAEQISGLKISGVTNTSTTITGLTKGSTYYFVVTAVNSYGEGAPSDEINVIPGTPPPPTGVNATAGNQQVTTSWNNVSCATSYNIYWSTTPGVTPQNGIKITKVTSPYTQTELTKFVVYYYVVTGVNSYGEGSPSNEVYAVPGEYTYSVGLSPFGIAIDASGNVWVINNGSNNVTELNSSGITIGTYSVGTNPFGIAIDASGNVWVTNSGSKTVTELNSSGITIGTYAAGSDPAGIAIDSSGNVWVTNFHSNTVTELNSSGITIGTYSVGTNPLFIAIDASGNVWVANFYSKTVTELNSSGITIGTYSVGTNPFGIAIDASSNVWVTNSGSNTVTELNSSGITIGTYSVGTNPFGIAIDASGNVWVTNSGSKTVTELNSSGIIVGTYGAGYPAGIAIDSLGNVWVTNIDKSNVAELPGIAMGPQYWPYTGPQWP